MSGIPKPNVNNNLIIFRLLRNSAAITQARGEKRKIEMQAGLNRLLQKYVSGTRDSQGHKFIFIMDKLPTTNHKPSLSVHSFCRRLNDTLSELQVPQGSIKPNYAQLSARNVS